MPRSRHQKGLFRDFCGNPVVKNLPANVGDMGSTPVREDSMCRGELSLHVTVTEAQALHLETSPDSLQLEKAREQQKRPSTAKNTFFFQSDFSIIIHP